MSLSISSKKMGNGLSRDFSLSGFIGYFGLSYYIYKSNYEKTKSKRIEATFDITEKSSKLK
ncbi:Hypothetical protein IALB_0321 [Ignavibacterium album JCM 16511]|uniref:Uncharacterized protein n=1 Tax=Ignavibacterium album (strain DSM 19864 / JCM 16511 / NBRC 101810 / Mat9-16) TaxID=945713 RepID=I0AGC6_IGNAJ|nr:Hypothetical protein IALB_0321 [Ignavibacterium album JCM 16511]